MDCFLKAIKTSIVNLEIWHTICFLIKDNQTIKRISRQSSIISNKGIVHKDMDIHGILKIGWWRAYLDSELNAKMRNKVSSIIAVKSSHVFIKRKHNQSNIEQTIVKKISCMLGSHQSPNYFCMNWFNEFHYWNHGVYSCLLRNQENHENYLEK